MLNVRARSLAGISAAALGGVSLAIISGAHAWASEADAVGTVSSAGVLAQANAPDVTAANSDSSGIQEIVVTAERRTETAQRAPLAITAISGADLAEAGITDVTTLQKEVTGLEIIQAGSSIQLSIRGVSSNQTNAYGEPDISYSVDDVYQGKGTALNGGFYDLQRVEVLKGPQGTLYGRNSVGGAINVITNDPTFTFGGVGEVDFGNYGLIQTTGALNIPISDTLAIRGAFQTIKHDGYLSDGYDDADEQSGRLKLLWKPSDTLTIHAGLDYFHQGGKGQTDVPVPLLYPNDPWRLNNSIYTGSDGFVNNTNWGIYGRLDWDLGPATFTIIPAYRDSRTDMREYASGQMSFYDIDGQQTTVEARLSSISSVESPLKWVAGLYFLNDDSPATQIYQKSFTTPYHNLLYVDLSKNNSQSYAAFGQATYSVTELIRLTGGLRYTKDEKSIQGDTPTYATTNGNVPPTLASNIVLTGPLSYDALTWKVGADADLTNHSLAYFNVSTGYKAGGFYSAPPPNTFGPEHVIAYSLGSKNRFFANQLQLNVELFDWEYKYKQVSSFINVAPPLNYLYATINAGEATIRGIDADAIYKVTSHDTLSLSVERLDARFDNFVLPASAITKLVNYSGYALPDSPKWSGSIDYVHSWDLRSGARLSADLFSNLVSRQWLDLQHIAAQDQAGYTKSDVSLRYEPSNRRWYLEGYGRNLENRAVFGTATYTGRAYVFGNLEAPRTYGVKIGASF